MKKVSLIAKWLMVLLFAAAATAGIVLSQDEIDPSQLLRKLFGDAERNGGRLEMEAEEMERLLRKLGLPEGLLEEGTGDDLSGLFRFFGRDGKPLGGTPSQARVPVQDLPLSDRETERLDGQYRALLKAYRPAVERATHSTVRLLRNGKPVALATAVHEDGFALTKSSELGGGRGHLTWEGKDGTKGDARVVRLFSEYDLVLVRLEGGATVKPVRWHKGPLPGLGAFLAAAGLEPDPVAVGVLSVTPRSLRSKDRGYLGVRLELENGEVRIAQVMENTPAAAVGLRARDHVLEIDSLKAESIPQVIAVVGSRKPEETLVLRIRRGSRLKTYKVVLGERPETGSPAGTRTEMMNRMGSRLSANRAGYPRAIQHDLPLQPEQCGGPLVDLDGNIIGINIARAGRIKSYAIPSKEITRLLSQVDFKRLDAAAPVARIVDESKAGEDGNEELKRLRGAVKQALKEVDEARVVLEEAEKNKRRASRELREYKFRRRE